MPPEMIAPAADRRQAEEVNGHSPPPRQRDVRETYQRDPFVGREEQRHRQ